MAENLAMELVCAVKSPEELLECLNNNEKTAGMYFLDLNFGLNQETAGLELAFKIRNHDPIGDIVFITSSSDMYKSTLKHRVSALNYIEKNDPNRDELVCQCIDNAHSRYMKINAAGYKTFVFKLGSDIVQSNGRPELSKGDEVSIDVNDILYFETSTTREHMIDLYTNNVIYELRDKLITIIERLDKKTFLLCQRNKIINLNRVSHIDNSKKLLYFDNGFEVEIAKKKINELKVALRKH